MAVNFCDLSLFQATPLQIQEVHRRMFKHWGKGQSLDEHMLHFANMGRRESALNGKLITWVLAPRDDPETIDFKCSCRTYRRISLVRDSSKGSEPESVTCYGVATVYTSPLHRGNGFAQHMMRLLHWVIADEKLLPPTRFPTQWGAPPPRVQGAGDGHFSALWSDVGDFYHKCGPVRGTDDGWEVKKSECTTTAWEVLQVQPAIPNVEGWTWLDERGVSDLWDRDADMTKKHMNRNQTKGVSFSFLPNQGVAAYQLDNQNIFLDRLMPKVCKWGVVLRGERQVFASWTVIAKPPQPRTLLLIRLQVPPKHFQELLNQIMEFARQHQVERVETWNLPEELQNLAAQFGGKTFQRDLDLPAIKWYRGADEKDIKWLNNERFCLC
ncbi:hypothetical protein C8R43DRAFT_1092947 [Mycena crocata]|nr:hypothetical protein C8R43DRAFT_1092947 [Mycena crocata]